jgi:bacteriocin-like protein
MDQKNLMAQAAGPVNPTTTEELPAPELVELSEEALQQIVGGVDVGVEVEEQLELRLRLERIEKQLIYILTGIDRIPNPFP